MPLCGKKKAPPMWFVLDAPKPGKPVCRQGPYSRAMIVQMLANGQINNTQLVWTNERIFPNAAKPKSGRLVRIMEWRRLDQLPDPVLRQLQSEAASYVGHTNPGFVQPMENVPAPNDVPPVPNHQPPGAYPPQDAPHHQPGMYPSPPPQPYGNQQPY